MVWDDAMQEPTAADHGDVLYNIGINSSLYLILDLKKNQIGTLCVVRFPDTLVGWEPYSICIELLDLIFTVLKCC